MTSTTQVHRIVTTGVILAMTITGCSAADPEPTGDALESEARSRYVEFRAFAPPVLAAIADEPWEVEQGRYGALPVACELDGGDGYRFDLTRSVQLADGVGPTALLEAAAAALDADGVASTIDTVGPVQQLRAEDPERGTLLVELYPLGGAVVSVDSPCWVGDSVALDAIMFPDAELVQSRVDYFPLTESPSDEPIFRFTGAPPATPPQTPDDVVTDD